ncbi:MAG: sulfotransferase family 2 domain-containing protein [Shimia thalassica]|uniref:sulfotransferase family 2 domain-containing protein n=1 Tax=Shimia thalassica TaxID=1715693 RepID=UPI0026E40B24|nr:sulfotransferase family 2 domain-containing protein [Shimia thalassica]MDO6484929.1 sulfotransferase family 2 domain-containing protein [Shimia thalassica]
MANSFDYFIVLAEMRTGSNFLEANLNTFPGLICHGEAFNPHFVGYPNKSHILGVDLEQRTQDPLELIKAIKAQQGVLGGFRFFHDHDSRVLSIALEDPRCAKIVLTRNPIDSYVSLKIARATGQWKLTDVRRRRDSKVHFDRDEFKTHLEELQDFQVSLMNTLQVTGQTAFYIAYEDLQDVNVMNGMARFLGQSDLLEQLDSSLKRQNPSPVSEKVSNFSDISQALAELDRFNLSRTPNFEPRRGPTVPSYAAPPETPLMYLPVRSGPEQQVLEWLAALDGVETDALIRKLNQKGLRQWLRAKSGHRCFTVVRHPVARAHAAFCRHILSVEKGGMKQIRNTLRKVYKIPLPPQGPDKNYDLASHREAFAAFLKFLKMNLSGQTSVRIDAHWASQSAVVRGFGEMLVPDFVLREEDMAAYLPALAMQVGVENPPEITDTEPDTPYALSEIYDDEIEALAEEAYQRDYLLFGFGKWSEARF